MLPRILIVDDESSICISLSLALEPEYEVIWETDPIRALERLQTEPIDLVLLDMVIGPYDGLDILMKIKKLAPLAAVIMMTAYGSIRSVGQRDDARGVYVSDKAPGPRRAQN